MLDVWARASAVAHPFAAWSGIMGSVDSFGGSDL